MCSLCDGGNSLSISRKKSRATLVFTFLLNGGFYHVMLRCLVRLRELLVELLFLGS